MISTQTPQPPQDRPAVAVGEACPGLVSRATSPLTADLEPRACLRCGHVGLDVRRFAISTCLESIEVVRCETCIAAWRRDQLVIVEELEDQ